MEAQSKLSAQSNVARNDRHYVDTMREEMKETARVLTERQADLTAREAAKDKLVKRLKEENIQLKRELELEHQKGAEVIHFKNELRSVHRLREADEQTIAKLQKTIRKQKKQFKVQEETFATLEEQSKLSREHYDDICQQIQQHQQEQVEATKLIARLERDLEEQTLLNEDQATKLKRQENEIEALNERETQYTTQIKALQNDLIQMATDHSGKDQELYEKTQRIMHMENGMKRLTLA